MTLAQGSSLRTVVHEDEFFVVGDVWGGRPHSISTGKAATAAAGSDNVRRFIMSLQLSHCLFAVLRNGQTAPTRRDESLMAQSCRRIFAMSFNSLETSPKTQDGSAGRPVRH